MTIHPYTRLFLLPSAPTVDEDESEGYEVGDVVISGGSIYDCTDNTEGAAVWQERGTGGASAWGDITGTLSDQSDLQTALDGKADVTEPIAATHIIDGTAAHAASAIANTPAGNIAATTVQSAIDELDTEKLPSSYLDTDGTLAANSDTKVASQKATKTYVDAALPAAETNANVICSVSAPGGASAFAGTIATLPGGAPTTLTYNVTSGQEGAMKPTGSTQLAKMRLYNTTRGTSALISDVNTATNTVTLTANVPAGWAVSDVITIASQTVSGGGYSWVDMEIVSGPTGKSSLFLNILITSGAAGDETVLHPTATYGGSKRAQLMAQVAAVQANGFGLLPITNNVFSWAWTANSTVITVREAGYIPS